MTHLLRFLVLFTIAWLLIIPTHSQSCVPCSPRLKITSETISQLHSQWILEPIIISMAFNQDSDQLYYVSTSPTDGLLRRVSLIEPIENEFDISWTFPSREGPPIFASIVERKWLDVASHPSQPMVAIGSEEGNLEIWNLEAASSVLSLSLGDAPITDLLFHPDGEWIAVVIQSEVAIVHLDDASIQWLSLPEDTKSVANLSFNTNGQWLATTANSQLVVWETDTFTPTFFKTEGNQLEQVLFLPKSDNQLVTVEGRDIRLWMLTNDTIELVRVFNMPQLDAEAIMTTAALNADGSVLVVVYNRLKAVVWNVQTGNVIGVPVIDTFQREGDPDYINTLAFSPDGYWLLYGTDYGLQSFIIP